MRALSARLRRLEQARHAAVNARPTPEEMRQAALTGAVCRLTADFFAVSGRQKNLPTAKREGAFLRPPS